MFSSLLKEYSEPLTSEDVFLKTLKQPTHINNAIKAEFSNYEKLYWLKNGLQLTFLIYMKPPTIPIILTKKTIMFLGCHIFLLSLVFNLEVKERTRLKIKMNVQSWNDFATVAQFYRRSDFNSDMFRNFVETM